MQRMPLVAVTATVASQIRSGALAAPQERVVVDELARDRVMAVAFSLGAKRSNHLRVTVIAALTDINVASRQLQWRIGF